MYSLENKINVNNSTPRRLLLSYTCSFHTIVTTHLNIKLTQLKLVWRGSCYQNSPTPPTGNFSPTSRQPRATKFGIQAQLTMSTKMQWQPQCNANQNAMSTKMRCQPKCNATKRQYQPKRNVNQNAMSIKMQCQPKCP